AQLADWSRALPDRLYLELTRTQRAGEEAFNAAAMELADALALPLLASNDVRFLDRADFDAHEARVCIATGRVLDDPRRPRKDYDERLARELGVIVSMGFAGYFLIVADFINWGKHNDIPVGPGRGSGAGSLVAWVLGITDLDPMRYDLLFERFLNPERVSMPDFDIDFCMDRRDEVIDYVARKYGRDKVSQIITYGTMAAKAVVRDSGRVLGYPYGFV